MDRFDPQERRSEKLDYRQVGLNVESMRKLRGWSQLELATAAGISRTTLHRIESGIPAFTATLEKIAQAFHIDLCEIYDTTRFGKVLGAEDPFVTHTIDEDHWYALEDRRTRKPANSRVAIQSADERMRLGRLGFVPAFASGMNFYLQVGPGINRLEIYGHMSGLSMPQFSVNAVYCLRGEVMITINDQVVRLVPGEVVAFKSTETCSIEPAKVESDVYPCEILFIGSNRHKVTYGENSFDSPK